MKKFAFILILFILLLTQSNVIKAEDFDIGVEAAILIDGDSGQVLFEKNADRELPPASITKVMPLLIAMEEIEKGKISLDDEVTVSRLAESMGGSQIFLAADTRLKMEELLKAVTIASANDASVAVAEAIAGTYSNFIDMMNRRAEELGMNNTHFVNSTGLPTEDGEHYSTARDLAVVSRELVKYPKILEWGSTWLDYLQLPSREAMLVNTNKLIRKYPGMDGLKTGHTQAAGFCLSATAKRNDMRLVSVVLNADSEPGREEATTRLLDYGFNSFKKKLVINKGDQVQNIDVPSGKKTVTTAEASEDIHVLIRRGNEEGVTKKVLIDEELDAPIKKGEVIGKERIIQDNQIVGEVDLIATEDIEKAGIFTRLWRAFVKWIGSLIEKI